MKRALVAVAVLVALGVPAYWWFIVESGEPEGTFALDLAELRRLAAVVPGAGPRELRVEHVSAFNFPSTAALAGSGWSMTEMKVYAYQALYDDRAPVLIDTAMDSETAKSQDATFFDDAAFARTRDAMEKASVIVVTHEHFDHLGGVTTHPKLGQLIGALKLTRAQLADPSKREPVVFPAAALAALQPLDDAPATAIAPGVVLWKAPGHTPGSQLVFVRRADGEEFLFLGDVAWKETNWRQVRERARLVTQFFLGEDRGAVLRELAAIKALAAQAPALHIVAGHDGPVVQALVDAKLLVPQFVP